MQRKETCFPLFTTATVVFLPYNQAIRTRLSDVTVFVLWKPHVNPLVFLISLCIEPNPGPRTTLQRAARTRRQIEKRLEKGNQKRKRKEEQLANVELKVATWNVRRANIYNGRFGEIVKECIERGWDIVCVSELNARVDGIKRYTHEGN